MVCALLAYDPFFSDQQRCQRLHRRKTWALDLLLHGCHPEAIILSKIIYNAILCLLLSLMGYFLFHLFIHNPVQDQLLFVLTLLLTSIGFSSSLGLISAISSKAGNSNILVAVLSFPVVISILLMAIKVTKNVLDGLDRSASYDELLNLVAINCISTALAYLLFPYIWRS